MYNTILGQALNYGQSMIPGKSRKSPNKHNLKRAILKKQKKGHK